MDVIFRIRLFCLCFRLYSQHTRVFWGDAKRWIEEDARGLVQNSMIWYVTTIVLFTTLLLQLIDSCQCLLFVYHWLGFYTTKHYILKAKYKFCCLLELDLVSHDYDHTKFFALGKYLLCIKEMYQISFASACSYVYVAKVTKTATVTHFQCVNKFIKSSTFSHLTT